MRGGAICSLQITSFKLVICTLYLKFGLTASLVFKLIALLLVFADQKKVHSVRDEMA